MIVGLLAFIAFGIFVIVCQIDLMTKKLGRIADMLERSNELQWKRGGKPDF